MKRAQQEYVRLRRLAWLLDSAVRLPGLKFRVGLDALVGLVPGLGDAAGVVLSSYIVLRSWQLGVPRSVLLRMALNVVVEGVVGAVPLLGDLFDAAWKANMRNVALLEAHLERPQRTAAGSRALLVTLGFAALAIAVAAGVLGWLAIAALLELART